MDEILGGNVDISVSSQTTDEKCLRLIRAFSHNCINARITPTISVNDKEIENGCLIRLAGPGNKNRKYLVKTWHVISKTGDYECAHLDITGKFHGCILNFIHNKEFCPGKL